MHLTGNSIDDMMCLNLFSPGGNNGTPGFKDFIYKNIAPACFVVPSKITFDLNDAQTFLVSISHYVLFLCLIMDSNWTSLTQQALQEIAQTHKSILQKQVSTAAIINCIF